MVSPPGDARAGFTLQASAAEHAGLLFLAVYARVQLWIHRPTVANKAGTRNRKLIQISSFRPGVFRDPDTSLRLDSTRPGPLLGISRAASSVPRPPKWFSLSPAPQWGAASVFNVAGRGLEKLKAR